MKPSLLVAFALAIVLGERAGAQQAAAPVPEAGPRPLDEFHPDHQPGPDGERPPQPAPAYGGRVILHLETMPKGLNRSLENSAVTRDIHQVLHEGLLRQDMRSFEFHPALARRWDVEDLVVLTPEAAAKPEWSARLARVRVEHADREAEPTQHEAAVLYGAAEEVRRIDEASGEEIAHHWRVTPLSQSHALAEPVMVPVEDVLQVERGAVFTFYLRDDVLWHPSPVVEKLELDLERKAALQRHRFDAEDVVFSWRLFGNRAVDCDTVRYQFLKITHAEAVDGLTVRAFYESQYYSAINAVGSDLCILPRHLYDLHDPDHHGHAAHMAEHHGPDGAALDAAADEELLAEHINDNPHNVDFVGLGPYRITSRSQDFVEGTRFDGYFDEERAGYFDVVRYRKIESDGAAFQALLNGEVDFTYRLTSEDYFGPGTRSEAFDKRFYKGYFYLGAYGFTGWNLARPHVGELAVRRAIAHAFPFEEYRRTFYKGLANQVTGPFPFDSPAYDSTVVPLAHDLDHARVLLEEAGWYDRDGDGIADKDGVALDLDYLMPFGNDASATFGALLQESLAKIGVRLDIEALEWGSFVDRVQKREFDGANLAWMPGVETDPEQAFHSRWADPSLKSSNFVGFADDEVDRWIAAGQRELDPEARHAIWRKLHRRIYELQPYLFGYNVPRKFAMHRGIRGLRTYPLRPGYSPREWYWPAGTDGTRDSLR